MPLLTVGVVDESKIVSVRGRVHTELATGDADDPAFILPFYLEEGRLSDMDVYVQAAVFVALDDPSVPRVPVDVALAEMLECVADIVPRFERFFT